MSNPIQQLKDKAKVINNGLIGAREFSAIIFDQVGDTHLITYINLSSEIEKRTVTVTESQLPGLIEQIEAYPLPSEEDEWSFLEQMNRVSEGDEFQDRFFLYMLTCPLDDQSTLPTYYVG